MKSPLADSSEVTRLVEALRDPRTAEPASTFPRDTVAAKQPGLYAWWVDAEGLRVLVEQLQTSLPSLIYAGLAGATHWPSGKQSTTTLWSRVRTMHLRGNIRSSTFRQTLAALLVESLSLQVVGSNRLTPASEQQLSAWMADHLRVAVQPYPDKETLGAMERAILTRLDPPLNLDGMAPSPMRAAVADRRYHLAHPM